MNDTFLNPYARLKFTPPINLGDLTASQYKALDCILSNFFKHYQEDKSLRLRFSTKSKNWKAKPGRISRKAFLEVVKRLEEANLIVRVKGDKNPETGECWCSYMEPQPALVGVLQMMNTLNPPIRVCHSSEVEEYPLDLAEITVTLIKSRGPDGKKQGGGEVDYHPTPEVVEYANTLHAFNQLILQHDWVVRSPRPLSQMDFQHLGNDVYKIKPHALIYKRTFHTEDKQECDFSIGGRFYNSSVSQMPSQFGVRQTMTIVGADGIEHQGVEVDLKCLHLNLARHLSGLDVYPGDAYELFPGQSKMARSIVKFTMLIMFNARSMKGVEMAMEDKLAESEEDSDHPLHGAVEFIKTHPQYAIRNVITLLSEKHKEVAHMFCSSAWKRLTRLDSEILHRTIKALVAEQTPAFLVHDSLIVRKQNEAFVRAVLENVYTGLTGFLPIIEVK